MEMTYPLERLDYWRFSQALIRRSPALRRQVFTRYLFVPLILAFEFSFLHGGPALYWALLALGTALWVGYLSWAQRRAVMRGADLRPGALGTHTMWLEAGGLRERTEYMESSVRWEKVTEILQSPDHLMFLLSPRYGFLVPTRAFGSAEQCEAFLETARAYWQAARDGNAPVLPQVAPVWPPAPRTVA